MKQSTRRSWSYYAAKALCRYFLKGCTKPIMMTAAHEADWEAAEKAVESLTEQGKAVLRNIYLSTESTKDAIENAAKVFGLSYDEVWAILKRTEKRFAKERGLA